MARGPFHASTVAEAIAECLRALNAHDFRKHVQCAIAVRWSGDVYTITVERQPRNEPGALPLEGAA